MTSEAMAATLQFALSNRRVEDEALEDRRTNTAAMLTGPLADGTTVDDAPIGGCPARWIRPVDVSATDGPIALYLHGGVFEVGSAAAYSAFCSNLALLLNATVVAFDYRLAPEHVFPAAIDDVVSAYRDLLERRPAASIALIGDSAGGGLVVSCLIAARRHGLPQPACAVALSAWTDLTNETDAHRRCADTDPFIDSPMLQRAAKQYLGGADPRDPLASPAHASSDDLAGLAPLLLQAAANEVLADDSSIVAERIADAGGDVTLDLCPEAFHVWHMGGAGFPESAAALDTMGQFVRDHWL
jgi:monoterpene epsilon-lactone hydrolase